MPPTYPLAARQQAAPPPPTAHPPTTTAPPARTVLRWLAVARRLLYSGGGLLLFVLALNLLKEGAGAAGTLIAALLHTNNPLNALGFGWLLAYVFLSGSPVAAIGISLFAAGTINSVQTFAMITGSRLGASFIVLLVGFFYYVRGERQPASIATGVLALLTTAAIYLPALLPGYLLLQTGWLGNLAPTAVQPVGSFLDGLTAPLITLVTAWLPAWTLLPFGVLLLLLAFALLDRALPQINAEQSAFRNIGRLLYRPLAMFVLGAVVTAVTLSVSVSLGILVPLSVKGLVRRENILPYIMGANITTFIDTLLAAWLVGGAPAFGIVLAEVVSVSLLSLLVLVCCYRPFERLILRTQEMVMQSRRRLAGFLALMLVIPLVLLLIRV